LCERTAIHCFRGNLEDVLDRYFQAAKSCEANAIVRITADCPSIDPEIVDQVIEGYLSADYDYFGLGGEFPDGLDCTVFSFRAIEWAWAHATLKGTSKNPTDGYMLRDKTRKLFELQRRSRKMTRETN
jgi:glutamate-1-semialdehyde 2,1-aminomutase